MILRLLQYQLLLMYRQRSELVYSVLFFLLVVSVFPLAIGSEAEVLTEIGAGCVWVAALLAALLSGIQLFSADFYDGTLEQGLLSPQGTSSYVIAKIMAHWLMTGLPLVLLAPLCGVVFYLPIEQIAILWITLLLGTPTLSLLTGMAVAFTVGLRQGGILLALLVFPLYIPVLIFACGAVLAAANELPVLPHLALLGAYLLVTAVVTPFVTSYALRLSMR